MQIKIEKDYIDEFGEHKRFHYIKDDGGIGFERIDLLEIKGDKKTGITLYEKDIKILKKILIDNSLK